MSTHIATLEGLKEEGSGKTKTSMSITRFWGGPEKGRMIQLTINNSEGYIQLTKKEINKLIKILFDSINE